MDAALAHAEQMIRDGADIIDIGGESTRPGHTVISDEEEIARVTPVIEAVKSHLMFRFPSTLTKEMSQRPLFRPVRIWSMISGDSSSTIKPPR